MIRKLAMLAILLTFTVIGTGSSFDCESQDDCEVFCF